MEKFEDLNLGDIFNTKPARYVKVSRTEALCIFGANYGQTEEFTYTGTIIVIWRNV